MFNDSKVEYTFIIVKDLTFVSNVHSAMLHQVRDAGVKYFLSFELRK